MKKQKSKAARVCARRTTAAATVRPHAMHGGFDTSTSQQNACQPAKWVMTVEL